MSAAGQAGLGHYRVNNHVDNTTEKYHWAGATYTLPHHCPPEAFNWGRPADEVNRNNDRYTPRALKTSNWEDAGGTVFIFEAWQPYNWGHCSCAAHKGPYLAYKPHWWQYYSPDQDPDGSKWQSAVRLWQEKHFDKASILFCDGHSAAMKMIDTVGAVKSNLLFQNQAGYTKVSGMWTRYAGD